MAFNYVWASILARPASNEKEKTMKHVAWLLLAGVMCSCVTAVEALDVKPELKPDPAVMKILNSLGKNQSAWLPQVKTHGNFNEFLKKGRHHVTGPRCRNYCRKWVWAPDRNRALFCGGNAGVPHKMNDVWEYDLAANTWVLLWEPDPDTNRVRHMKKPGEAKAYLDTFVIMDKKSGEIMTKRGAPFDPVHTWWALTYDPQLRAMLWVMGNHHLHSAFLRMHPELKKDYRLGGYHKMRLWAYYPHEHRWEFMNPKGPLRSPAALLEYVPELKGSFYYTKTHRQSGVFRSETKDWTWKKVAKSKDEFNKLGSMPPSEAVAAYDSKNKVVVVHHGGYTHRGKPVPKRTHHYDVTSGKWEKVLQSAEGPVGHDAKASMTYDSTAQRCFINHAGLWSYNTPDKTWTKVTPQGPGAPGGMACYNPEYNVLMIDPGGGKVWVYRHRSKEDK
jgi:hypothetical protein